MRVRTIVTSVDDPLERAWLLRKMRRERELHMRRLREAKPEYKAKRAIYNKAYREANRDLILEAKRRWRDENRERFRAYYRRYDELTPGRREYKAAWSRNKRAANAAI